MQKKVSISGSSTIPTDIDLGDDVVVVVVGEVSNAGERLQQTAGRVPYVGVKITDLLLLDGVEAREMRTRVLEENQDADLHVINGNGDSDTGTG